MINLKNNSSIYHLTSYPDGVMFDLHSKGNPIQLGWTEPESEVGILALDRNGNGAIDSGFELFGSITKMSNGHLASNGFEALIDLDGGPGVSDGQISPSDASYSLLRLWFDDNHDGVSQPNELRSLADSGVTALFTEYRETPRMDNNGNYYWLQGEALVTKHGSEQRHKMFDVMLIAQGRVE
jgi:hypothetical protein